MESPPSDVQAVVQQVLQCAPAAKTLIFFDVSKHSSQERLWVLDLKDPKNPRLVTQSRVAHGSGSDPNRDGIATAFGNIVGSGMTSLGLYKVAESYYGKHGKSWKLDGLWPMNNQARNRYVVLHSSNYVTPWRVGNSLGCPAVPPAVLKTIESTGLKDAYLFVWHPGLGLEQTLKACKPRA